MDDVQRTADLFDDFANDKEILRLRQAAALHKEMIDESMKIIRMEFGMEECTPKGLETFVMYKNLKAEMVEAHERDKGGEDVLVVVAEYLSSYATARNSNSGRDVYLFGRIGLKKKYPKTYVCKETIREKLMDLLMKKETDFPEHKKFSNKFHVLTQDPARLTELFRFLPMDELIQFPDMELEIQGDHCFFRHSRRPVSPEEARAHIQLTKTLMRVLR